MLAHGTCIANHRATASGVTRHRGGCGEGALMAKITKRVSRRSFVALVTGAAATTLVSKSAAAQETGRTDSDSNDRSGYGRTSVFDSDSNDRGGYGRTGYSDGDSNDRSGYGRGGGGGNNAGGGLTDSDDGQNSDAPGRGRGTGNGYSD